MTFCETLATTEINGYRITAQKCYEKFSSAPYYYVIKAPIGSAIVHSYNIHKCAKTTWKKVYKALCNESL